jgi:hypothetical protein
MKHTDILNEALKLVAPRGKVYGDLRENHALIAQIATLLTGKPLNIRDIALIMVAVKLARATTSPDHVDSWVDAVNYLSFAGDFSTEKPLGEQAEAKDEGNDF